MKRSSEFWDALAPHHAKIEDSFFDRRAVRQLLSRVRPPVLVVGAGQGLIVEELQKAGMRCDGVDLSPEMIRYAALRRGLELIEADARTLPFGKGAYKTIVYATGVLDFMGNDADIRAILKEGKRIVDGSGIILVGFYRISRATKKLMTRLGLLRNNVLRHRESMEVYRLGPARALAWVSRRANVSYLRGTILALQSWAGSTWQEKRNAFHMQRIFGGAKHEMIVQTAPEELPYRDEAEILNLFGRLGIPIRYFEPSGSCYLVEI